MTLNAYSQTNSTGSSQMESKSQGNFGNTMEFTEYADNSIISSDTLLPDGYMLHGTKMTTVKNGIMKLMKSEIVLQNGTRIKPDGNVFRKNKPVLLLNYGEYVDPSGKILPMNFANALQF